MEATLDYSKLAIAGVSLIPLVVSWVQISKRLGLSGNWLMVEAFLLATIFTGLSQAIGEGLIPEAAIPWIRVVIVGLGGGAASCGAYDLAKKFMRKFEA
jgi:hypothetical protein